MEIVYIVWNSLLSAYFNIQIRVIRCIPLSSPLSTYFKVKTPPYTSLALLLIPFTHNFLVMKEPLAMVKLTKYQPTNTWGDKTIILLLCVSWIINILSILGYLHFLRLVHAIQIIVDFTSSPSHNSHMSNWHHMIRKKR